MRRSIVYARRARAEAGLAIFIYFSSLKFKIEIKINYCNGFKIISFLAFQLIVSRVSGNIYILTNTPDIN